MFELYAVSCPHCGASGQLSDPGLKGTAIYCPACSKAFVIPAATNVATALPVAVPSASPIVPPVTATAGPSPAAVAVAVPVVQPGVTPLAVAVAVPVAQAVIPGSSPPIATAIPVIPVAAAASAIPTIQRPTDNMAPVDFPNVSAFQTEALTPIVARTPPPRRPSKPQSPQMGLLKVALLSIFSAVSLFGIVVLSQKTPRTRPAPVISATTKKPKKSSRRKATSAAPKPASVTPESVSDEMPEADEIKPAEPKLELAATTPAAPKMEKPATPPPAAPTPAPQPAVPEQTAENIPTDVKLELDNADDNKDFPSLIAFLTHAHAGVRQKAAEYLYRINEMPELVQPLLLRLADSSPAVRKVAIQALAKHGVSAPEAILSLGKSLQQDADHEVKSEAADALARLATGNPERAQAAAGPILAALEKSNGEELFAIVAATGSLGEAAKPALPTLIQFAKDPRLGEPAVGALAELGHFETFPPILAGTDSIHVLFKSRIAEGLGKLRPMTPAAVAIIKTLSADKNETVRVHAIEALIAAEPKLLEAIPVLEKAQTDENQLVKDATAKAIVMYTKSAPVANMRNLLAQMLKSQDSIWEENPIAEAMKGTQTAGFGALIEILSDPQSAPELRIAAGQVLALSWGINWEDAKYTDELQKLFADQAQPPNVRVGCAIALIKLKDSKLELAATVLRAVGDNTVDWQVREAAAYMVPVDQDAFLPTLVAAAEQCEVPLPADLSKFEREKRSHFYAGVLAAMGRHNAGDRSKAMPRLVAAIRQDDGMVKMSALSTIGIWQEGSAEAVAAIRETLKHEQPEVRESALRAIGKLHETAAAAIPDLRAMLQVEDRKSRGMATWALSQFGPAAVEAVPDLIALLLDEKRPTSSVPQALAKIAPQDESVLTALLQALDRADLALAHSDIIYALKKPSPATAPAILATLLKRMAEPKSTSQQAIFETLGRWGEVAVPAIPGIVEQLANSDPHVRKAAARAIGQLNRYAEAMVPNLVKMLGDPEEDVQEVVLEALKRFGRRAKSVIPDIEKFIATSNTEETERIAGIAKETLEKLKIEPGDSDPVLFDTLLDDDTWQSLSNRPQTLLDISAPAFIQLTQNGNETVRSRAWSVIADLPIKPEGILVLEKWFNGADSGPRALAAILLRRIPSSVDRGEFAQALWPWIESDPDNRNGIWLLVRLGPPAAPTIAAALTNERLPRDLRNRILESILQFSEFETRPLLTKLEPVLKSEVSEQKRSAALAISRLNPRHAESVPLVLECLSENDYPAAQIQALQAIGSLKGMALAEMDVTAARPILLKFLEDAPRVTNLESEEELFLVNQTCEVLLLIGVRPEDLPQLKKMLPLVYAPPVGGKLPPQTGPAFRFYEITPYVSTIVASLGSLGPSATDAISHITSAIACGFQEASPKDVDRYAQGLAGISEPVPHRLNDNLMLKQAQPAGLRLAIRLLGILGKKDERSVKTLTDLLKDEDLVLKIYAAMALANEPATFDIALPVLREALRTVPMPGTSGDLRSEIIAKLATYKTKSQESLPELLQIMKHPDTNDQLRADAARALLDIAPESTEVRAAYLECLKTLPESAAELLLPITQSSLTAEIVAELTRSVENTADPRRAIAAALLGLLEEHAMPALPALRALMQADQGAAGLAATIAVAQIDPSAKDVVPQVLIAFQKQPLLRVKATHALRRLGPNAAEALPALIAAIEDPHRDEDAYRIIGSMGAAAKPALALLKKAVVRQSPDTDALRALQELGPAAAELGPELLAQLKAGDDSAGVIGALVQMGEPSREAVEILRANLQDEARRLVAVIRLAEFKTLAVPAVPDLIKLVSSDDSQLRIATIQTLARIGPDAKESAPLLATSLTDADPRVAAVAASALVALGDQALPVLPQVIAALEKPRRGTQSRLIELLNHLGPAAKEAVPTLTKLETTNDVTLRHQVRQALEKIQATPETKVP
ncbi:MAG: repeat-containing protein [Planctomycetaceae bacterium]|nr:repeat-containing protein [Planctomycetaceae bacterium]